MGPLLHIGVAHLVPVGEGEVQVVRPAGVAGNQEAFDLNAPNGKDLPVP